MFNFLLTGEFLAAGLAFEILNRLLFSMTAVSDQGMDIFIGDAIIFAFFIWTHESRADEGNIESPRGKNILG